MTAPTVSTQDIDRLLAAAVDSGEIPGLSALAVTRDGTRYSASFGERADGAPWSENTVAWLGSMTKMIVAIGALQLVEQGRLDLDADLGAVLPALAEPWVLADHPVAVRPGHGLGVRNLDWVGKAIEAVSGQDLEQYLRGSILDPLGMSATSFRLGPALREELVAMNFRSPEGLVRIEFEMTQEPEFLMGGGAMYGSPADYLTLLRMVLGGGEVDGVRILREDTVAAAMSNQIGDLTIGKITTVDPGSSNDVDFLPGTTKKWSLLGLLNVEETPEGRSAGSLFWAGLPNAYYWVDRDKGQAGVLVTQILPFGDHAVLELFDRFENAVRAL